MNSDKQVDVNDLRLDALIDHAKHRFKQCFDHHATVVAWAPGRINLIGDHTDYNEGFVLPMTISRFTVVVGRSVTDRTCAVGTVRTECDINETQTQVEIDLNQPIEAGKPRWSNYVRGVLHLFPEKLKLKSFQALIVSNLPIGQGLSSSASLETSFLYFLEGLVCADTGVKSNLSLLDRALICQQCEHQFVGLPCGLMDQLIVLSGDDRSAVLIDCQSFQMQRAPLDKLFADGYQLLVVNSHIHHDLALSEYADRKRACERVNSVLGLSSLRMCSLDMLNQHRVQLLPDDFNKALHVINENGRTKQALQALIDGDYRLLGQLMFDSHASLRDLYQTSCKPIDQLVEWARTSAQDHVLGARITGGGFGGCVILLIRKQHLDTVCTQLKQHFSSHHQSVDLYVVQPVGAANFALIDCF